MGDLDKLIAEGQAQPSDIYSLAMLYLDVKDWKNARELLRRLATSSSEDPQYTAIYIRQLLEHGEVPDAESYLQQLERKWPNHVQTVLLQAELLVRRGKPEEALDLMKGFIDRDNAIPNDRSQRIRYMALSMEDFAARVTTADQSVSERFLRTGEMFMRAVRGRPSVVGDGVGGVPRPAEAL